MCQVAGLLSATIVLAAAPAGGDAAVTADEECRCEHSAAVMCPMHKRSSPRPPGNAPRWCAGVGDSAYAVLPVLGTLALPERVAPLACPDHGSRAASVVSLAPRSLGVPPDSPPPRA